MKPSPSITPAELEVLRYLTDHQPATVREVADHFARADGRARTTVLTLMERLQKKGYIARRSVDGVYEYYTRTPETQVTQGLVRSFVQQVLGGEVAPLLRFLGTEAQLSEAEVAQLKRLVEELPAAEPVSEGAEEEP